jgi:urease accessory protein
MLATLLLHGAGIIAAKLVVLSATCLVAIFFTNIAQANTTESDVTNNSKNIIFVKDLGFTQISPFLLLIYKFDYGEACHSTNDQHIYTEDNSKNCLDIGSDSKLAPRGKNFHNPTVKASVNTISENSKVAGNIHGLAWKQASFLAQENLQPVHQLYYSGYLCCSNVGFRHHYPNINHTPGKDLLSNGVGLTSPPELFVNLIPPQNSKPFRIIPVLSFEDHTLQMAVAKHSPGNLSVRKTNIPTRTEYVNHSVSNVLANPVCSNHCKNNPLFCLTPTNPIFHPNGLVYGAIVYLDLLSMHTKIFKIQSSVTPARFFSLI